jgi:hypothetical protein
VKEVKNLERKTILQALEKDIARRYISTSIIQSDGRLHLDAACIGLLSPKDQEEFTVLDDNSSIIIVRKPLEADLSKVLLTTKWDSKQKRLRLPPNAVRILLACKVGFRAFRYGNEVALEAEPFIEPRKIDKSIEDVFDLGKYVLRSSRSLYWLNIVSPNQKFYPFTTTFKLIGEYWIKSYHRDVLDPELKEYLCSVSDCEMCKQNIPISKTIYWFPIISYDSGYSKPGLISIKNTAKNNFSELFEECKNYRDSVKDQNIKQYHQTGFSQYVGNKLFEITANAARQAELSSKVSEPITQEEKGLMKLALKELETFVSKGDN